jgi:hypothetical protein
VPSNMTSTHWCLLEWDTSRTNGPGCFAFL